MSRARILAAALGLALVLTACGGDAPAAPSGGAGSGLGSAPRSGAAGGEPGPGSPVYTDWSRLTPYEPPERQYSRFEPYQGDALTAREDYGPLLPYLGRVVSVSNYIVSQLPLYGLVTADGRVVTDPVYADISAACGAPGFLVLLKGDGTRQGAGRESEAGEFVCTVAALDGRWVRRFGVAGAAAADETHLAVTEADGSITVLDAEGRDAARFPRSAFTPYLGEDFVFTWEGGPSVYWNNGVGIVEGYDEAAEAWQVFCYLDPATGAVSETPPGGWAAGEPDRAGEDLEVEGYRYLTPTADPVTGAVYYYGTPVREGGYDPYAAIDVFDQARRLVFSVRCDEPLYGPIVWAGLCASYESGGDRNGVFSYVDRAGNPVFRYPLRSNSD